MLEIPELVIARARRREQHDLTRLRRTRRLRDRALERHREEERHVRVAEIDGERLGRLADQIRRDDVGPRDVLRELVEALALERAAEDQVERRVERRQRAPGGAVFVALESLT